VLRLPELHVITEYSRREQADDSKHTAVRQNHEASRDVRRITSPICNASRAVGLADLYRGTPAKQCQASLLDVTCEVVGIHRRLIVQAALPLSARGDTGQADFLVAVAHENGALIGVHVANMSVLSLGYNPAQVHEGLDREEGAGAQWSPQNNVGAPRDAPSAFA